MRNLRVVDLFCGCGGLSLGFQNSGFNIVAAFDYWDFAINIYKNNFSHPVIKRDLRDTSDLSDIKSFNPNFIIGGPPCQDYSTSGHRDESLGRAELSISFAKIIAEIRPLFFLMENVPNIQRSKTYSSVIEIFHKANYGLTRVVLDASLCGVPQKRKRFITFGALGRPDDEALSFFMRNLSSRSMTVRDYFGDSLGFQYYFRVPTSYKRRGIYSIDEPSMTIRGVDRPVPKGYKGHPSDPVPMSSDIRSLTIEERAQIQTFPCTFNWYGSKTQLNQTIGNAVPVKLAEYIANCISEYINETC